MIKNNSTINNLVDFYPSTRFMGSKRKILPFLDEVLQTVKFESCLDAFSGSGIVSYYLKKKGKLVYANDFMSFPYMYMLSTVENDTVLLDYADVDLLVNENKQCPSFIRDTFNGLYFPDADNEFLDNFLFNIETLSSPYKKSLAYSAIVRACLKRRPRGVFTYIGARYDDGRQDLKKTLKEHFLENVVIFNQAVFSNGKMNKAFNQDVFDLDLSPDLVYFDPPYFSTKSDNDYCRRYHFIEGLVKNWNGLEIQQHTKTKKFKKYKTPFDNKVEVYPAFERLFDKFRNSIIIVSYSSNSLPNKEEMIKLLKRVKPNVEVFENNYLYSFGNQADNILDNANRVKEYIFIGK